MTMGFLTLIVQFAAATLGTSPSSTLAQPAEPLANPATWVNYDDYPAPALRANAQGTVQFRLTVSTQGLVDDCVIVSSSGSPLLDETTCRVVTQRARFKPARNALGQAVPSQYFRRVNWRIQQDDRGSNPETLEGLLKQPALVNVRMEVDLTGKIIKCDLLQPLKGILPSPCATALAAPPMKPFTDANGYPVVKTITVLFKVDLR